MLTFEIRKYVGGRWLLDSVFDDKSVAVAEAKQLMERNTSLPGVRVVAVAEEEAGSFREWTVFRQMIVDDEQALQRAFQLRHEPAPAPAPRRDRDAELPRAPRLPRRRSRPDWLDYTGWSLCAAVALGAVVGVVVLLARTS
jgi:ferric-dicitrate binding protein FerR (iron transport regulator)